MNQQSFPELSGYTYVLQPPLNFLRQWTQSQWFPKVFAMLVYCLMTWGEWLASVLQQARELCNSEGDDGSSQNSESPCLWTLLLHLGGHAHLEERVNIMLMISWKMFLGAPFMGILLAIHLEVLWGSLEVNAPVTQGFPYIDCAGRIFIWASSSSSVWKGQRSFMGK